MQSLRDSWHGRTGPSPEMSTRIKKKSTALLKLPDRGDKPSQPYRCDSEGLQCPQFTPQPQQIGWMDGTDVGGFSVRAQEFDQRAAARALTMRKGVNARREKQAGRAVLMIRVYVDRRGGEAVVWLATQRGIDGTKH